MKLKLFLDSDGVFSDFLGGMKKFFNFEFPKNHVPENEYKEMSDWVGFKIWSRPFFWVDLDPLPGAKEFYEAFRPHNPSILTAVPHSYTIDSLEAVTSGMEKKQWWRNFAGPEQVTDDRFHWTLSHLKHEYCKAKEDPEHMYVLIDDHKTNIKDWEAAGGVGILHENIDKTLFDFHVRVLSQLEPETVA